MKQNILFFTAALALSACVESPKHSLTVEVESWGNDSIFVAINDNKRDTLIAQNGVVTLDLDTIEPYHFVALTSFDDLAPIEHGVVRQTSKSVEALLLPKEKATIKGVIRNGALSYGTSQFADFAELYTQTLPYDIAADSINRVIEEKMKQRAKDINELFDLRGDEYEKIREQHIAYIKHHPDSEFAAYLTVQMNTTRFMECYTLLSERVKNGKYRALLEQGHKRGLEYEVYLAAKESGAIAVGHSAPDFTLPSINGDDLSLSGFRGKWVILDFWGSWCAWCIKGVPDMKRFYNKYSDRVEIVGLACKDTDEKWRASVEKHQMNWINLFDNQNIYNQYAVSGFPTKILIDPKGEIQQIVVGESENYYEQVAKLIAQ